MSADVNRVTIPDLPKGGPYSHATVYGGTIYLSGLVGVSKGEDKTFSQQWELASERAQSILAILGSDLGTKTIKVTVYLSDEKYFDKLNRSFENSFGKNAPARTTVVCRFPMKEVKVEIDIVAAV